MKSTHRWMSTAIIFFLLCSLVALPNGTVYAASFSVNDTRDRVDSNPGNGVCRTSAGTCTLRAAIQEANARSGPDVIQLRATTYMLTRAPMNENNISTGDLDITAPLTILGSSSGVTIIDGGTPPPGSPLERTALDRLFEIHPTAGNVTFERLTIREGWDEKEGGAIYNRSLGAVRLVNVNVLNSFAGTSGGGIYYDGFEGGSMLLDRSTITGNSTNGSGGGIYITNGRLTVIGTEAAKSTISGNSARDGGGLYHTGLSSQVDLSFTNVSGNLALNSGGGIYNGLEGELSLADVSISTNAAVGDGGGLASVSKASLSVTRGTFSANTADSGGGGAFTQTEGSVTIDASTFSGNAAGADGGGGLYVSGKGAVNVTGSVVSGNTAIGEGGGMALHSDGPVDISDTTVNGNISQDSGGGILASGLVVSLTRMNITHNTALEDGGGIDNQGSGEFAILDTSITSNTAGNGGGLSNRADSTLLVSGSTFRENHAAIAGGGFLHQSDAATDIVNTTLSGNSAGLNGGGLYLDADAGLHVINTTITLNSAPHGSGVGTADAIDNFPIVSHPLLLFRNTIVAGNIGGPDCHAAFGSEGGNLDGGTLCNFQGPRDRVNVLNLGLEVLADNGGPTLTHALTAASPAVGAGVDTVVDATGAPLPGCPETDQRGVLREQNRACDIGAYEFEGTPESQDPPDVTHPETSLDSGPADSTENTGASFAFSASEPGSTFECSLDVAPFTPCGSPVEYAALSEGMHTFEVRAIDPAGNTDPTPASFSWTIELPPDGTPPETTIDSGPGAITEIRDAMFTFSASESGSTFECSLDGVSFAVCVSPAEYVGLTAGAHIFAVRATDLASNQDPTPANYAWAVAPPPDNTPPVTSFTSGPASPTESTDAIFIFSSNEPGSTFECALDGPSFNACISLVIYTGLSVGEHTFAVRATDPAGNLEPMPASYTWTIVPPADTIPPETTLASGPASPTESTNAQFTFSASESGSAFECALDAEPFAACSSPADYTSLSVGDHTFEVRAIDPAGNVDPTAAVYTWTIEGVEAPPPPAPLETFIDSGPAGTTEIGDATFTFSASEEGATFECSLDGAPFSACFSPIEYVGLAPGHHAFEVRAGLAGSGDTTPASYAWTVEQPSACNTAMLILHADADAWIDQNSSTTNKGDDSILKLQSKAPSDNFRALVHFAMPDSVPSGCIIKSATLSLHAASATPDRTLEALQIDADWSENAVTWLNQPGTLGPAATTDSGYGNLEWNVTVLVQAMYSGSNFGFLIRDASESGGGAEQQFHSREKGESMPQLVITFAPAP